MLGNGMRRRRAGAGRGIGWRCGGSAKKRKNVPVCGVADWSFRRADKVAYVSFGGSGDHRDMSRCSQAHEKTISAAGGFAISRTKGFQSLKVFLMESASKTAREWPPQP